jgi:hypothetical protein
MTAHTDSAGTGSKDAMTTGVLHQKTGPGKEQGKDKEQEARVRNASNNIVIERLPCLSRFVPRTTCKW